jgi:multiple sugar transport system ATP-binding protein
MIRQRRRAMADVRIQGVTKSFGDTVAINDLDLAIKDG